VKNDLDFSPSVFDFEFDFIDSGMGSSVKGRGINNL